MLSVRFQKGRQICRKKASADTVSSYLLPSIIDSYADQTMHFFAPFFGTKGLTNTDNYIEETSFKLHDMAAHPIYYPFIKFLASFFSKKLRFSLFGV